MAGRGCIISNTILRESAQSNVNVLRGTPGAVLFSAIRARLFHKTIRRRAFRLGLVLLNVALVGAVVVIVVFNPSQSAGSPQPLSAAAGVQAATHPVDQLASVNIAATVAAMTNMSEAPVVNGQALAAKIQSESGIYNSASTAVAKPQVVKSAFTSNKDIQTYIVKTGDTFDTLAATFGVSSNSIRWSNGLSYYSPLVAGKSLLIPPVDGIVYTVKSGDTPQSLAQTYAASQDLIIADNDAELHGLTVGERIIIPGGTMPTPTYGGYGYYNFTNTAGTYNMYQMWNCTWWVAYRWAMTGRPIMPLLGNAAYWYGNAQRLGLATGTTPRQYAAAVTSFYGFGHVVFVESVNADGGINTSEMNVSGLNTYYPRDPTVTRRTVSAAEAANYRYVY